MASKKATKKLKKAKKLQPTKTLIEVVTGMGSQSTGAGAGKVTFNPF